MTKKIYNSYNQEYMQKNNSLLSQKELTEHMKEALRSQPLNSPPAFPKLLYLDQQRSQLDKRKKLQTEI